MGLLDKLFGKKNKEEDSRRLALDRAREITSKPLAGDSGVSGLLDALGPKDFETQLEAVNLFFELDRIDWAEALALHMAHDPGCPLGTVKGLIKHFATTNRAASVMEPSRRLLAERPSESDVACAYGRELLKAQKYEQVVKEIDEARRAAPHNSALYALVGEAHIRLKNWELAVEHLRVACELTEEDFRHGRIVTDELNTEQLEYSRIYNMLEEAARAHHGPDDYRKAFENIHMEPSSLGVAKEAERLAVERIDYKPHSLTMLSQKELSEGAAKLKEDETTRPLGFFLEGMRFLRELDHPNAMDGFRNCLQLDIEAYGAYYGWAACEGLQKSTPADLSRAHQAPEAPVEAVFADWANMTPHERTLARVACAGVTGLLEKMAAEGTRAFLLPLDVRLPDIIKEKVEVRFAMDGRSPKAIGTFAPRMKSYTRLDELFDVQPSHFVLARQVGYLAADVLEKSSAGGEARKLYDKVRHEAPNSTQARGFDSFIANAVEGAALASLFPEAEVNEFHAACVKNGVYGFLAKVQG